MSDTLLQTVSRKVHKESMRVNQEFNRIEHSLEDQEDYQHTVDILARVRNGQEKVFSSDEVK